MEPKNKEERRSAFGKFLLLFVVCIGLVLTLAFFSVRVPFSENEKLRAEMDHINNEKKFSEKFAVKMVDISRMLDTINRTSVQESVKLESKIETDIGNLNAMVADTIFNRDLYINIVHNLGDLQAYLKELRDKTNKDGDLNEYKQLLQKANEKKEEYFNKYLECATKKT